MVSGVSSPRGAPFTTRKRYFRASSSSYEESRTRPHAPSPLAQQQQQHTPNAPHGRRIARKQPGCSRADRSGRATRGGPPGPSHGFLARGGACSRGAAHRSDAFLHAASKCEIACTAATGELASTAADGLEQHCAARGQPWDECGARATPECSRRRHRCCCWLLRLWPPAREAACARAVDARLDHQLRSRRRNSFQE